MGVKKIVSKLNEMLSTTKKNDKHYQSMNNLLNKLKEKEKRIKLKLNNERDTVKLNKLMHTLLVINAQQKKAEKILNIRATTN